MLSSLALVWQSYDQSMEPSQHLDKRHNTPVSIEKEDLVWVQASHPATSGHIRPHRHEVAEFHAKLKLVTPVLGSLFPKAFDLAQTTRLSAGMNPASRLLVQANKELRISGS